MTDRAMETRTEERPTTCVVCGREIIRPWIDGIQKPWMHWVEPTPDGHAATPEADTDDGE